MSTALQHFGKVPRDFLEDVIFRNLGATNASVIVKPGHGFDNAIISVDKRRAMIVTADPLSFIPSLGPHDSAWLTVQLLASDFTTSGVPPQFAMLDFNLPPHAELESLTPYFKALSGHFKRIGVSIVGGHTGRYPGCDFTIVGGGVLFGIAERDGYVTPAMARDGDLVLVTKGAAVATTAVLARAFPKKTAEGIGEDNARKARAYLYKCSTVREALLASAFGLREKVTSMHDATEGGILGGLYELSSACKKGVVVERERILVSEETQALCSLFGLDPLISLSEGSLIITCKKNCGEELMAKLARRNIASSVVGRISGSRRGLWVSTGGAQSTPFVPPQADPYWEAYSRAATSGWN